MPLQSVIVDVVTPPPTVVQVVYQTASDGVDGTNGLSAYELAVAGGFIGTQQDWLESLAAAPPPPGDAGEDGLSAYDIAVQNGFIGTQAEWLASLQGADADAAAIAAETHAADAKTTPADVDEFGLVDSAASWSWKRITWANLKAALKAFLTPSEIGAIPATGGTMTNGTLAGTLAVGVLTTTDTTKTNLRNAAGLGKLDAVDFAAIAISGTLQASSYTVGTATTASQNATLSRNGAGVLLLNPTNAAGSTSYGKFTFSNDNSFDIGNTGTNRPRNVYVGSAVFAADFIASNTVQLKSFTVATLPSVTPAGAEIYVSNESGGAVTAFSDGTNWRRVTDRAIVS